MNYVIAALALLLAVAVGGDAWLYHENGVLKTQIGAATQADADTRVVAKSCGDSVDKLAAAGVARDAQLQATLRELAPQIAKLNKNVITTMGAKPSNPADLCGSAAILSKSQINARKAGAQNAKP